MLDIEKLQQRPLSVFHIPQELLRVLHLVDYNNDRQQHEEVALTTSALEKLDIQHETMDATTAKADSPDALTCNTCDLVFSTNDRQDHRKHFSTDWHRYNIKRKLVLKQPPVSLYQFESMIAGKIKKNFLIPFTIFMGGCGGGCDSAGEKKIRF